MQVLEKLKEAGVTFSLVKSGKTPWRTEYLSWVLKLANIWASKENHLSKDLEAGKCRLCVEREEYFDLTESKDTKRRWETETDLRVLERLMTCFLNRKLKIDPPQGLQNALEWMERSKGRQNASGIIVVVHM